jgi:hypothetical protein
MEEIFVSIHDSLTEEGKVSLVSSIFSEYAINGDNEIYKLISEEEY